MVARLLVANLLVSSFLEASLRIASLLVAGLLVYTAGWPLLSPVADLILFFSHDCSGLIMIG